MRRQMAIGLAATLGWPVVMSRVVGENFYPPLAVLASGLAVATVLWFRDRLRFWLRITPLALAAAVVAGVLQALLTHVGYQLLVPALPALREQVQGLYALMNTGPGPIQALPLVAFAIIVEEVVWRGVLLETENPTRRKVLATAVASTLSYTLAQAGTGSWALAVTAFVCGWLWWAMRYFGRSLSASIVMHLLWSLIVLVFVPLEPVP